MPFLTRRGAPLSLPTPAAPEPWLGAERTTLRPAAGLPGRGFLRSCANESCSSGWLQIWRSRSVPVFEGGWTCSPECTAQRVQAAVRRELDGWGAPSDGYRHRVPLGLLMLDKGWITAEQLRGALQGQRANHAGRIGHWLIAKESVSEQLVTRALGLQWSCPVLPLDYHDPEGMSPILPRLFVDAFGALPLRVAAGKLIYLGFEDHLDAALSLALERMSGLRVESGLVQGSQFRPARTRMLEAKFPAVELLQTASEPALVRVLANKIDLAKPFEARLVRVHDCLWLRMWVVRPSAALPEISSVRDVICTFSGC